MYTISIWNNQSSNFNTNDFVRLNGTETFYAKTENQAIRIAFEIGGWGEKITRLTIKNSDGKEIPGSVILQKVIKMLFEENDECIQIPLD